MWIDQEMIDLPEELIRTQLDEEELEGMARSLQAVGQLQAILVKKKGERYELMDGFRRLTAIRMIKRKKVNCTIKPENYQMSQATALIANIQKEDMPPLDEAKVVRDIVDEHGWGIPKTAQHLGKPESWIRGRLDLNRLPENIAARLQAGQLGIGVALELSRIPNEQTRDTYTEYAADSGCTLAEAQRWRTTAERDHTSGFGVDPNLEETDTPPPTYSHNEKTNCGMCGRTFPTDRVRIIKTCPVCYETVRMEEDSGKETQSQTSDAPLKEPTNP